MTNVTNKARRHGSLTSEKSAVLIEKALPTVHLYVEQGYGIVPLRCTP